MRKDTFIQRKNYSIEFKRQAVSLILVDMQPVRLVSKQLEVHENTLYRWVAEYEQYLVIFLNSFIVSDSLSSS
ncbi:transposase [Listeria sp. PSOL-1]|uniref:transposase n=1 Tax=Listeria sp. PSOL-1 TaxID=1844999 RepID=UPI0013D8685E